MAAPTVMVQLDKERHLRFDLNAMAMVEDRLKLGNFAELTKGQVGAGQLRVLLWAALLHEDKNLTVEQVGAWVDGANWDTMTGALGKAIEMAFGMPEEPVPGNPPMATA